MKVKVSYTLGLDEVPQVVEKILLDCKQKLINESSKLRFSPYDFSEMVKNLDGVRETLLLVEENIQDVINITSGWIEVQQLPGDSVSEVQLPEETEDDQDD